MGLADYIKKELPNWPNWLNLCLLFFNRFGSLVYGRGFLRFSKDVEHFDEEKMLLKTINFAIKHVEYYRKRYSGVEIKTIDDFKAKIGFIDKNEVMEHWEEFLVDGIDMSKCNIGTTGGTSGKPLKLVIPKNRYITECYFVDKVRKRLGWNYDVRAVIRNHKLPDNKNYMVNPITKEFLFDAFRMDERYACQVYRILKKYKVKYIHAYPSAVYQFLKLCNNQNLDLSILKGCFLGSEGLTEEQILFFKSIKVPICYTYGHSEKLIYAGNNGVDFDLFVEPKYGYCEIIDAKGNSITNGFGELVGSTYYNKYFYLIRYKTGDFADVDGYGFCGGEKMLKMKKVYGRRDKSVLYKADGTTTSLTALNVHGDFYEHINGMQYIQEQVGYLKCLIIKNGLFSIEDERFIKDHLSIAMGGDNYICIEYVDKLIFQENGKFLPLISKL